MEQVNFAVTQNRIAKIEQELFELWQKRKGFLRARILAHTIKNLLFISVLVSVFLGVASVTLGVSFLGKVVFVLLLVLLPIYVAWNIFEQQVLIPKQC